MKRAITGWVKETASKMRGIKTRLIIFWLLWDKRPLSHKLRSKVMREQPQPQHHHHHQQQHSITNVVGLVINTEKKHMYLDPEEEEEEEKDEEDQYPPGDLDQIMYPEEEEEEKDEENQYPPGDLDHIMYPEEVERKDEEDHYPPGDLDHTMYPEEEEEKEPILEWLRNTGEVKGQKFRLDHHNIDQAADLFITRFHRQLRTQNSHHNPHPQHSV